MGLTDGLRAGDLGAALPRLLGAAAAQVPATWVLAAAAFALAAALPRWAPLAWPLLFASVLLVQLGQPLHWPAWLLDASPFRHVPQIPFEDVSALPSVVLVVAALALAGVGLAGLQRRDVLA